MKPTAHKRLGKYVLLGRLGHGGMGKIYLAFAPGPAGIEKLLVIKRLHSHLATDPALVASFLDEARLSMALTDPHIVHTYDVGEVGGRYFMVMEHVDGQNLGVLLRTAKRSDNYPQSTLWGGLFLGVLDGLHAAHGARDARGRALSIIHRDVSPQNIIITYDGVPKLVDFGIAKAAQRINETDAGVLKGKYSYMSPEQTQSETLDPRSDVFAAGIVFWEMLAGRRLYKSDSVVKSVERILGEPPIPPLRVNDACDPGLSKVVVKALQKAPEDRFATAEEFRHAIDDALHASGHHYRQSETRDLMAALFADVRDGQRQVLDACLASAAELTSSKRPLAPQPSIGPESFDGGSESDLEMLNLAPNYENETTTPSSALRSPLVTAEADAEDDPLVAAVAAIEKPAPGKGEQLTAADIPGDLAALPTEVDDEDSERGWLPIAAALAALLLVAIGGIAWAVGAFQTVPSPSVVAIQEHPTPPDVPTVPTVPTVPDVPPTPDAQAEAPVATTEPVAEVAPPKAPTTTRRPSRRARDRRDRARPVKTPPATAVDAPASDAPREPDAAPTPALSARLTLETVPWTVVYLGKKKLGETPVINAPIPAGEIVLTLVNTDANIRQEYFLKTESGKSYRKKLKLD